MSDIDWHAVSRDLMNCLEKRNVENAALRAVLRLLLADIEQYPAWQRPCYAVDRARALLGEK